MSLKDAMWCCDARFWTHLCGRIQSGVHKWSALNSGGGRQEESQHRTPEIKAIKFVVWQNNDTDTTIKKMPFSILSFTGFGKKFKYWLKQSPSVFVTQKGYELGRFSNKSSYWELDTLATSYI